MDSEKTNLFLSETARIHNVGAALTTDRSQRNRAVRLVAAVLLGLMTIGLWLWSSMNYAIEQSPRYPDFDKIEASATLKWYPCHEELGPRFLCSKLRVPMDYHRPLNKSGSPHVDLALVMYPARSSSDVHWSRTPMLFNPGGPGGSGVEFLLGRAPQLQQIVGDDYDLVSFDPRGIGYSRPTADCFAFPSNGKVPSNDDRAYGDSQRVLYTNELAGHGLFNYSSRSTLDIDSRNRALGQTCAEKDAIQGEDSLLRHIATPNVAQDMVSIIDAWKDWRQTQCASHRSKSGCCEDEECIVSAHEDPEGKLVYWGFSYGTLLGATFAAMFPDRVHRIILDGVVDADHYVSPTWSESIVNTDDIVNQFCHYCYEAGVWCDLYRKGDSEADICARIDIIFQSLKDSPIHGVDPVRHVPALIEYPRVKSMLFIALYAPIHNFPYIASYLNTIFLVYQEQGFPSTPSVQHAPSLAVGVDSQLAIMCGDKRYPLNDTIPILEERHRKIAETSNFADVWMTLMDTCSGWSIPSKDPPMRWDDHPTKKPKPIKTRFPLLFLSNTFDPVTPLVAGNLMARKFVDAGLVELKTEGHCTLAAVSRCMTTKIRDYLSRGKVPSAPGEFISHDWETCEADETPWKPYEPMYGQEGTRNATTDREMWEMHKTMNSWKQLQEFANTRGDFGYGRNRLPILGL
ncbi:alpha/beta-hydrolase [Pseudovirgaria hyperparasitica]|uniref:Alpha/beta-hydrolase n=1 Tax=Pseudovirgaria hyperparasitica TaxID=470096 RepID=A0A6A6W1K7_9PEZI|nr:alpha/beta-hydrolase [Pseudovirgaria hyperparasitica]KAF2754931.1 alpha/beta-hydrolase [Pseudovirgaria hyperparasitica]